MALTLGAVVSYGEHEIGTYNKSIEFEIKELKQKLVDGTITAEEKEKLVLLK